MKKSSAEENSYTSYVYEHNLNKECTVHYNLDCMASW
jgi:hypothetical protein